MPIGVGTTFTLDYRMTEYSLLRKDISYSIVEMTDDTFSTPAVDSNGDPIEPCVVMQDDGLLLATKVGFALIVIESNDKNDFSGICHVTVLPKLNSITLSQNSLLIVEK